MHAISSRPGFIAGQSFQSNTHLHKTCHTRSTQNYSISNPVNVPFPHQFILIRHSFRGHAIIFTASSSPLQTLTGFLIFGIPHFITTIHSSVLLLLSTTHSPSIPVSFPCIIVGIKLFSGNILAHSRLSPFCSHHKRSDYPETLPSLLFHIHTSQVFTLAFTRLGFLYHTPFRPRIPFLPYS